MALLPGTAREHPVIRAPIVLIKTASRNDTADRAAARCKHLSQRQPYCTGESALLAEHLLPEGKQREQSVEQRCAHSGGRSANVFLAVRTKRSPRATRLERAETSDSRSTSRSKRSLMAASR